jgi:putative membrane protein
MTLPLMHAAGAWPYLAPLWIFSWILVIFLAFRFFFGRRGGWCGPGRGGRGPDEILAERFARGEIDATEYRSRLDTLRQ